MVTVTLSEEQAQCLALYASISVEAWMAQDGSVPDDVSHEFDVVHAGASILLSALPNSANQPF